MRFLVLGPLEVRGEGEEPKPIPGSKERMILADLIAHAGRVVSVDDLIQEVWGERPPRTAEKTLGSYVSRLRRALEPGRPPGATNYLITGQGSGYALRAPADAIDADRFERLADEGRDLLAGDSPETAARMLDEALELWRGTAYQDFRYTDFGAMEGGRLEELRRSAMEDRIDARLALGDTGTAIAELESMVKEEPLRERRWGQLMLALYRTGRQAESLQAFVRARAVLVDELGIEPGPDLQRLQTAILTHDPALDARLPSAPPEPAVSTSVCPYKGLARFETSDAEFYFGREQVVAEAVGRLVGGTFLALIGASGSGKSSLLRAGLLHALASGALPGSDDWTYALVRPGDHPLDTLGRAIAVPPARAGTGERSIAAIATSGGPGRLFLAVDQFEEVFTECTDGAERKAFLDAITDAASIPDGWVTLVIAMRADFYGRGAEHRALASLLASDQILVGPMDGDELRRAIELPAQRAGLTVEEELADALVADTVDQPGGLPLLSTALLELWTRRQDETLRLDDYLRAGGVEGAVARLAEAAFGRLDAEAQEAARRILLRLAGSEEGTAVVRRRAPLAEFDLDRDVDASRALAVLTEARLVTVAEGTAEVAHEALLRDWPRLRSWLEDDAEGRKLHRHLTETAGVWDEGGRDDGDLYRGARLTSALDWEEGHEADPNDLEREFLGRSRAVSEGEAARARRTNRRLRGSLAGVAALLVLSLVVGNLALRQRDDAQAAAVVADSRQLAAASLVEQDQIVSLLLAREAVALDDSAQARGALLAALQRDPAAIAVMHAGGAPLGDLTQWLRLSPDGRILAAGGARSTVDLFDAATHRALGAVDVGAGTTAGAFSPDGGTLVVAVGERIVGIDVHARTIGASAPATSGVVRAIVYTPAGDRLFTAESNADSGFLVPRNPVTLEAHGTPVRSGAEPITAMASSVDGRWLVTTGPPPDYTPKGGHTSLWDARTLQRVGGPFPTGGNDVALSPDGRTAAIAASQSEDRTQVDNLKGELVLLDMRTGKKQTGGVGHQAIGLTGLVFSSDGRSVISTGDDHRVLIWDASSATVDEAFTDPSMVDVRAPALSPDGATVFTIDVDGNVVAWDLSGDRGIVRPFTAGSGATSPGFGYPWFAVSPDGRTLAIIQAARFLGPGSVRLVDTSTLEPIRVIPYNGGYIPQAVAFSPDSETLAVTSMGGYIRLWDVGTGEPDGPPFPVPASTPKIDFWVCAFSPDGSMLATGGSTNFFRSSPGVVILWDVATGQPVERLPEKKDWVTAVNFTSDGTRLVASTGNGLGDAVVWNLDEHRVERTIQADDTGVFWADISDDGTTLVTAGQSNLERLFDLDTGDPIGRPLNGPIWTVDLSPDGRTLVAAGGPVAVGGPGQVAMWDVATGTILSRSFPGPGSGENRAAAFAPDGRSLFVVSETGKAWEWDVDQSSWRDRACEIAGRSMTPAEWRQYLPDRPYQATCGS